MIDIDRRDFIAGLGGAAAVSLMSHEARADELEDELVRLDRELLAPEDYAPAEPDPTGADDSSPEASGPEEEPSP